MSGRRLIVIGAGPVGLAAALSAVRRGWEPIVLEREEIGASLARWGPTPFFTPLGMNVPPGLATGLPDDIILTGPEFVERVLRPLADCEELRGRVRVGHRVVAVGRAGLTRGELAGHPLRAERPFRVLVEQGDRELLFEAEAVLDASGTYGQPVALGEGGVPALGERTAVVLRNLGEFHEQSASFRGQAILLVGHGHSAAHALCGLAAAGATVTWATRSMHRKPFVEIPSDPLPVRRELLRAANELAQQPPAWLRIERRAAVQQIGGGSPFEVELGRDRRVSVDRILGLTGYRPDLSMLSELALEISPATEGAGRLARALANVTDCLTPPSLQATDLDSGEPGFHLIGAKSYGRARTFLLQNGYAQVETILDRLG